MVDISKNLLAVNEHILRAVSISGRKNGSVKLIAVTKSASLEQIQEAISLGVTIIAEGRVQVASEKFPFLNGVEKHMIGHLQTNKVKAAVELFDCIQSVDSLKLLKEIDNRARDAGKVMKVMLQLDVALEEQKFGIPVEEIAEVYKASFSFTNIKVIGIMAMAPFVEAEETRAYFKKAKEIQEMLKLPELSIGMSNDFEVAIEEGSTMVRVGRAIFS